MANDKKPDLNSQILELTDWVNYLSNIIILMVILIVSYQAFTDKREPRNATVIILSLFLIHQIMTAIRNYVAKDKDKTYAMSILRSAKVIVPRGEFINLNVKPETNLYEKDLVGTNSSEKCVFIVVVEIGEFKDAPVLLLSSTYNSKTSVYELNKGNGLLTRGSYMFNIVTRSDEFINFRFNSGGIVKKFVVEEYYVP